MNDSVQSVQNSIINGDIEGVKEMVQKSLAEGTSPVDILYQGLIPAMDQVGSMFESGDIFVPEMLVSAYAMKGGLKILKPFLVDSGVKPVGKVVIGSVQGDLHDIGKNLVAMLLEGAGFEITDLGTDVSPAQFVNAVKSGADLVCISALLTTTMPNMKNVIDSLVSAGYREQVKVLIGGAPITAEYAQKIGADGYASDASQAAVIAKSYLS